MPELAEVAYACSRWNPGIEGFVEKTWTHPLSRVFRDLDRKILAKDLTGAKLLSSSTRGKQMLFRFSKDLWLGLHLGMTGSLALREAKHRAEKHDALILFQKKKALVFTDPRQFGRIRIHRGKNPPDWWERLPTAILDSKFKSSTVLYALQKHARRPVKSILLDQRYFQGIGNWMADEILWRSRLHPAHPSGRISERKTMELFRQIKFVARGAMNSIGVHGGDPPRGWLFHARWKNGGICPLTKSPLARDQVGGRTSCWSPKLQRLPHR